MHLPLTRLDLFSLVFVGLRFRSFRLTGSIPSVAISCPPQLRKKSLRLPFLDLFSILLFVILVIPNFVFAQEWQKNIEKKSADRWTLQEWLNQKDRNRLMDQWLMLHTPTPYEFALELDSLDYGVTTAGTTTQYKTLTGSFLAYASVVGLEFKTNNNATEGFIDNTSYFHIRMLGSADQGSHLTLSLGQKSRKYQDETIPIRNQYLGQVDLTLYFNKNFGFTYLNKGYYPITGHAIWGDLNGSQQSLRLFIDFAALRIFGGLYSETESQTLAGISTQKKIQGSTIGLKLYF